MLDVICAECGRVLIGSRMIDALIPMESGMRIDFTCGCGRPGTDLVRSGYGRGRGRDRRRLPERAPISP